MFHLYMRVSTTEQAGDRSSLSDQERKARAAMLYHNAELGGLHTDAGVSGTMALRDRPAGNAMLAALKKGDIVVAAKMDRLFRSATDALGTIDEFKAKGIGLILCDVGNEPVTHEGPGRLFVLMLAGMAEFERWRIAERMEDGRKGKIALGGSAGGSPRFGTRVEGKGRAARVVPVEREQQAIAAAKELHRLGYSQRMIAKELEQIGFVARNGKRFVNVQIMRMLEG